MCVFVCLCIPHCYRLITSPPFTFLYLFEQEVLWRCCCCTSTISVKHMWLYANTVSRLSLIVYSNWQAYFRHIPCKHKHRLATNDELRHVITNNNVIMPAAYSRNENKPHLIIRPIPGIFVRATIAHSDTFYDCMRALFVYTMRFGCFAVAVFRFDA